MPQILELIFKPQVQKILDSIGALFDTRVVFFSPSGEQLRVGAGRSNCEFCTLLQEKLGYAGACRTLDRRQRRKAYRTRKSVTYRCHAGLHEAIIPVIVLDDVVGVVTIGQFRSSTKLSRELSKRWRKKWRNNDLEKSYENIQKLSSEKVHAIIQLFEMLVHFMTDLHLITVRSRNVLEPVLSYMQESIEKQITLTDAAAHVYRSPSTLSHQFKRLLGKSFKQVQAEMLIEKAKEYFGHSEHITVAEVAYQLGFSDARYFSRVFKKVTGKTPSDYRKRLARKRR